MTNEERGKNVNLPARLVVVRDILNEVLIGKPRSFTKHNKTIVIQKSQETSSVMKSLKQERV